MSGALYQRDHQLHSLFELTPERLPVFQAEEGVRFSKFKHLDQESLQSFALRVAALIEARLELKARALPITILAPAHRHLKTAGVQLAEAVAQALSSSGAQVQLASMSRHELNSEDFGTLTSAAAREALISGRFYYEGPTLTGERVVLIEDAVISGAHWVETQRALHQEAGVELHRLMCVCVASVNPLAFSDGDYAVEDLLNHLWVKGHEPGRLIELIQDPPSQLSARSLKLLLGAPWSSLTEALDVTPWRKVLSLYYHVVTAAHQEGFGELERYAEPLARFERYASRKLKEAKSQAGLKALYELNEDNLSHLFKQPWWEGYSLSEAYSLLKFGHMGVIERFAQQLAELARELFASEPDWAELWAVAAPGYQHAPGAARPLAERVAHHLGLPVVYVSREDVPEVSYGALGSAEERFKVASGRFEVSTNTRSKRLLIDDAVVSGANIHVLCEALKEAGAQEVRPLCLINVASPRLSLEEHLNASVIHEGRLEPLIELLREPSAPLVMRAVKLLLSLSAEQLTPLLPELPLWRWVALLNVATLNGLCDKPRFKAACELLFEHTRGALAHLKVDGTPPYTPLITLTEHNTSEVMRQHGRRYSALKYGDPSAAQALLSLLLKLIHARLGAQLSAPTRARFVVAGSNITFIPNAARYLAELASSALGLPLVDLRATGTFVGEFGALNSKEARAEAVRATPASVSDPSVVEGREVIYLDDCVVSGAHLAEQVRALKEAGASAVHSFCLIDVSGESMSLEAELNYALVNPRAPTELINILTQARAPLLARSPKVFLRLPPQEARRWLSELPTPRLFEMWEAVQVEGFSRAPELKGGFEALSELVAARHLALAPSLNSLSALSEAEFVDGLLDERKVDVLMLDYDETLAPTLTPLSQEGCELLSAHLRRGAHLVIVSAQPIGERGLSEHCYEPLKAHLSAQGELSRLAQLTLMPSEGLEVFEPEGEALTRRAYFGLPPSQLERGRALIEASEAWRVASRRFERGPYTSLHFVSAEGRDQALVELNAGFQREGVALCARAKRAQDPNKHVLHLRPSHMSKALARDWVRRSLLPRLELRWGRAVPRARLCVMGDKLGVSEGLNDDSHMLTLGALNLALGDEAHPLSDPCLRGERAVGGLKALKALL